MAEWLYEAGIGEERAALVDDGAIVAGRVVVAGDGLRLGTVADARLVEQGRLPLVRLTDGREAVLPRVPPGFTQGALFRVRIVREAIPERGRAKRAVAAAAPDADLVDGPTLADELAATGTPVRLLRPHEPDTLEAAGWSELLEEAASGEIAFPGGALRMHVTPAMTLFDVDGDAAPDTLALTGARAAVAAILRFGIGGSIGLDLPTLTGKAARQAVAEAIDAALPPPFERTAVNGFGFLQIVRRRERASLPELLAADPAGAAARALLRRVERTPPPGERVVAAPPTVRARLAAEPGWLAELARRTGRTTEFA